MPGNSGVNKKDKCTLEEEKECGGGRARVGDKGRGRGECLLKYALF